MKLKVDGAGVGSHVDRASVEGLGLGTMAPEAADTALSEEIRWTPIAENRSAESRRDRIARAAYYLSEARGFEPGHDAEDWLLGQSAIDALDASMSLRP
jgi:Protein of unknown function (DUF2934)